MYIVTRKWESGSRSSYVPRASPLRNWSDRN